MEKIVIRWRLVCLFFVLIIFSCELWTQHIHWHTDYEEAKREALLQTKLMLIFCNDNKEQSERMLTETWSDSSIVSLTNNFICIKLSLVEINGFIHWGKYDKLSRMYRVNVLPTTFIADPMGKIFLKEEYFIHAGRMKFIVTSLPRNLFEVYLALDLLQKDLKNVALKIAVADAYHKIRVAHISNMYYEEVMETDTFKTDKNIAEHVQTHRAINFQLLGELKIAIDMFEELLDIYPESVNRPAHLYFLTKLYLQILNEVMANNYLTILRKHYPANRYTLLAEDLFKK
ncbi:MAG: hypothetical protein QME52_10095 [Bacteroidota bacterium]|nr:hypothetical protein [Bacteroidota bacterium]